MKKKMLPIKDAEKKFRAFKKKAGSLGFSVVSAKREKRDLSIQGVVPPDSERLQGLESQVILEKQVDDLTIRVVTTYDPVKKAFPVNGKFWVRIVRPDPKSGREPGVFTWKTTRTGDFLGRAFMMMEFLNFVLENRSVDVQGNLLQIESRVGIEKDNPYIWTGVASTGGKLEIRTFMNLYPAGPESASWRKVRVFIQKWMRDLWYYETKRRKKKGYKLRERDIRKKYTTKKGNKKK